MFEFYLLTLLFALSFGLSKLFSTSFFSTFSTFSSFSSYLLSGLTFFSSYSSSYSSASIALFFKFFTSYLLGVTWWWTRSCSFSCSFFLLILSILLSFSESDSSFFSFCRILSRSWLLPSSRGAFSSTSFSNLLRSLFSSTLCSLSYSFNFLISSS